MDPLPVAGLKVVFLKEGEVGIKDGKITVARSSRGYFFLSLLRVRENGKEVLGSMHHWRGDMSMPGSVLLLLQHFSPPFSFHVF